MAAKVTSLSDLAKHKTKTDLWIAIHGNVYNVSPYTEDHPGGVDAFLEVAGTDATEAFEDLGHSPDARELMQRFLVGPLEGGEHVSDGPAKLVRHLEPVKEESAPPRTSLLANALNLRHIATLSAVVLCGFAAARKFEHVNIGHHHTTAFAPTWLLYLAPVAVTTSCVALGLMKIQNAMERPHERLTGLPAHIPAKSRAVKHVAPPHAILDPRRFIDLQIAKIEQYSHDVKHFVLSLPKETDVLGLPIGQHISLRGIVDGKPVNRSYTPTSSNKDRGRMELVIKIYDNGLLTGKYLDSLKVGDTIPISGPRGQMRYRKGMAKSIGMLAGGTGITPMFQIIRAICEDPTDQTPVSVVYANKSEGDILLKKEMDTYAQERKGQFKIYYILDKPPPNWKGGVGFCTLDIIKDKFPSPEKGNKVMLCGPPGMINAAKGFLKTLGFEAPRAVSKLEDQVFCF